MPPASVIFQLRRRLFFEGITSRPDGYYVKTGFMINDLARKLLLYLNFSLISISPSLARSIPMNYSLIIMRSCLLSCSVQREC